MAVPGLVDLSDLSAGADGVAKIVLESMQELLIKLAFDGISWPSLRYRILLPGLHY